MIMKKILLLSVLAGSLLFAEGTLGQKAQMETMQKLEKDMSSLQKGFLYNSDDDIKKGIDNIKTTLKDVLKFDIKVESKDKEFNPKSYLVNEVKAIDGLVTEIDKLYSEGKKDEALASYSKTLSRCMVCHKIIRKW